jgi:hypothetical protein
MICERYIPAPMPGRRLKASYVYHNKIYCTFCKCIKSSDKYCQIKSNKGIGLPGIGDFVERSQSLAATHASWINSFAKSGSGSSVGLLIDASVG